MIKTFRTIHPRDPILVAAWPGMGQVALRSAEQMKKRLRARFFAGFDPDDCFYQTDIRVEKGVVSLPKLPRGKFYHWTNPKGGRDIIFFISSQQPSPERYAAYAAPLLNFTSALGVRTVFSFAAILSTVDHMIIPQVWYACTDLSVPESFPVCKMRRIDSCHISGMNGLILGLAKEKGMNGLCLLSEIPFYASQIENPRASLAVLRVCESLLGMKKGHYDELSIAEEIFEEEVDKLMDFIKKPFESEDGDDPIDTDDIERFKKSLASQNRLPNSAKSVIEDLFTRAQEEPKAAVELKKKLDEWHVYHEYEDRFLQLFRKDSDNRP